MAVKIIIIQYNGGSCELKNGGSCESKKGLGPSPLKD